MLESRNQIGYTHFWSCPTKNVFNQLLIFVNLDQQWGCFIDLLWRNAWFKNPASEWLRPFWHIFQEQSISQTEDLYRNTVNNTNFHYKTNSGEINDQISAHKNFFSKKSGIHNLIRFSSTMSKFREIMIQFQENNPTDKMERWTDPISWEPSGYC